MRGTTSERITDFTFSFHWPSPDHPKPILCSRTCFLLSYGFRRESEVWRSHCGEDSHYNIHCSDIIQVIQEESALLWEMIVWVILSKKVHNEHGFDFERLRSYGHFLIPVHAIMWTALCALQALLLRADSPHPAATSCTRGSQPSGSLCCGRRRHFRKPSLSIHIFKLKVISRS
jgi:hypothetical protein